MYWASLAQEEEQVVIIRLLVRSPGLPSAVSRSILEQDTELQIAADERPLSGNLITAVVSLCFYIFYKPNHQVSRFIQTITVSRSQYNKSQLYLSGLSQVDNIFFLEHSRPNERSPTLSHWLQLTPAVNVQTTEARQCLKCCVTSTEH